MAEDKKTVAEMFGEFLREAAVLTAVFLPMDRVVGQREDLTWSWLWITVSISLLLFAVGVMLDLLRKGPHTYSNEEQNRMSPES